ncbi:MAG: tellurite resistance TerB family protein [Pseudorhodoplanes sp.]
MFDAKRLLDQFVGQGFGAQGNSYGQPPGGVQQNGLGGLAQQAGNLLGGNLGGIGGGALAGGLAGILMGSKGGRKLAGNALMLGGMAAVGALAYHAYRNYQAGKAPAASLPTAQPAAMLPAPADTPFNPATESEQQSLARNLLRAMIAAAKADGHVDAREQANIFSEMDKLDLDAGDKAFVIDEMRKPLDVDAVARCARTPEEATEIYAASLLAIDVDNPSERGYLNLLAARMNLDEKLVAHLHATIEGATEKTLVRTG